MTRILITGSRDWADAMTLNHEINRYIAEVCPLYPDGTDYNTTGVVIVNGACPTGADEMASEYGVINFIKVETHPANWTAYGKAAGFIRNADMVRLGADVCLAFIKNNSKGATHTADLAEAAGIPTRRFRDDE